MKFKVIRSGFIDEMVKKIAVNCHKAFFFFFLYKVKIINQQIYYF